MFVVTITTMSAASVMLKNYYMQIQAAFRLGETWGNKGWVNPFVSATLILAIVTCTAIILIAAFLRTRHPLDPTNPDTAPPPRPIPTPNTQEGPTLG
jgi:hypothetical protein